MSMTDPIADMLTRIRNACQARHRSVDIPASKIKLAIAKILLKEDFIQGFQLVKDKKQGIIRIDLKYDAKGNSPLSELKRVSTPGLRIYTGRRKIPKVVGGMGVAILSTSQGILSDKEARVLGVGGEVLCYIW